MKYFCNECNSEETYIKKYKSTFNIKGNNIEVNMNRRFCSKCNNLVYDHELDDTYLKDISKIF